MGKEHTANPDHRCQYVQEQGYTHFLLLIFKKITCAKIQGCKEQQSKIVLFQKHIIFFSSRLTSLLPLLPLHPCIFAVFIDGH
jgi:hypothetical protein